MLVFLVKFFLSASAIIVIILVMLQKGKGGGLAGALGGAGGQSAFGTKAGDLFTKITVGVASFWILISILTAIYASTLTGDTIATTESPNRQQSPSTETPPPGKPADSGAGNKPAGPSTTDKGTGATEKGTKASEPAGKPANRTPEKPGSTTPPPVSTPPAK